VVFKSLILALLLITWSAASQLACQSKAEANASAKAKAPAKLTQPSTKIQTETPPELPEVVNFQFSRKGLTTLESLPRIDLRKTYPFEDAVSLAPRSGDYAGGGGGVNGGGGGGGVLCYQPGQAPDGKSFHLALVIEAWDWTSQPLALMHKNTRFAEYYSLLPDTFSIGDYLRRALNDSISGLDQNPLFKKILLQTLDEVLAQMNQCRELPNYVDDRGRRFPEEEQWMAAQNCHPVQLAWRSPVDATLAESQEVKKDYKIEFNCRLLDRLGYKGGQPAFKKVNQAVLVLHEALYLMGARLKRHPTSAAVRTMTNLLLANRSPLELGLFSPQDLRRLLRTLQFDDYFRLFPADPERDKIKLARQASYLSAVQIVANLRRLYFPLPRELEVPDAVFFSDIFSPFFYPQMAAKVDPFYLYVASERDDIRKARNLYSQALVRYGVPQMTDEEAFLFAASLIATQGELFQEPISLSRNFEQLLTPGEDDSMAVKTVCNFPYDIFLKALEKALAPKLRRYCESQTVH
jgi:hypothetical protein